MWTRIELATLFSAAAITVLLLLGLMTLKN